MLLDRSGHGKGSALTHTLTPSPHRPLVFLVFPLISRRRFSQIEVLEGVNVLVCINGRKNKLRVYYLSWLRNKILKGDDVSTHTHTHMGAMWLISAAPSSLKAIAPGTASPPWASWSSASTTELVGWLFPLSPFTSLLCTVQHERMKFLCIGTRTGVEVYAWAQKPYSKFMAFKVCTTRTLHTLTATNHTCSLSMTFP